MRLVHVRYSPRECLECGASFIPIRTDQVFCTGKRPKCKQVSANRELARAKAIYRELYHHVSVSGTAERGASLSAIMRQARAWRDEDRAKGVQPPPKPERVRLMASNARYKAHMERNRSGEVGGS